MERRSRLFAGNGSLFVSYDTKGNVAIQYSVDGSVHTGSPSLSISGFSSITNAPTVDQCLAFARELAGKYDFSINLGTE